jgi:hypothetical protein
LKGSHEYLLPEKRFRKWTAGLETNEALGIDLRLTFGGTFGKYLVKTNNTWFTVSGGLAATQEIFDMQALSDHWTPISVSTQA